MLGGGNELSCLTHTKKNTYFQASEMQDIPQDEASEIPLVLVISHPCGCNCKHG